MSSTKTTQLSDIVSIVYITPENAVFREKNQFLSMSLTLPDDNGAPQTRDYDRVFLHRAFPFDHPESYISVQDAEKNEIGMIAAIADFPLETANLLLQELSRKYYAPELTAIRSIRDRYGYAYCTAVTAAGEINFTLRDITRSIVKIDDHHVIITDIDGNRYNIQDVQKLDRKSYRQIELYI